MSTKSIYDIINTSGLKVFMAFVLFVFTSCENDLKEVERISSQTIEDPVDISYGVKVIYSEIGRAHV